MLDTEALATERVSITTSDTSWQLGVKRDCRNSVISGSTKHSIAKMNDNLADAFKKVNPKHQDEKQSLVYSYEEGLTIVSQMHQL